METRRTDGPSSWWLHRLLVVLAMVAVACGGSGTGEADDVDAGTDPAGGSEAAAEDASGAETDATAADEGPVEPSGTLRIAFATAVQTLDPARAAYSQITYLRPVFDTLLTEGEGREVLPGLATEYEYDGQSMTMTLRDDVTFSDGTPFDAAAVKANLERGKAANGPQSPVYAPIDSVEAPDATSVVINLSGPSPTLPIDLTGLAGMMLSPAAFEAADLDTNPIGSGPFVVDTANTRAGDRLVYSLREDHWDPERQNVESIEILELPDNNARINALRSGQVDVIQASGATSQAAEAAGFPLESSPDQIYAMFVLDRAGTIVPALADERVRRAMAHAIDREAVVEAVFSGYGQPTAQPFLEDQLGYSEELADAVPYDPDLARELMADAGYEDGFEVTIPTIAPISTSAEAVAGFLGEIGIRVTIEQLQPGTLAEAGRSGRYPLYVVPVSATDPHYFYRTFWAAGSPYNRAPLWTDDTITELGVEGATLLEEEERAPVYAELMETVVNDGTIAMLGVIDKAAAYSEDEVAEIRYRSSDPIPIPTRIRLAG